MKIIGIYCIRNLINNKVYIGQSLNIKQRIRQHKSQLNLNKHTNSYLQRSCNKYGLSNFEFIIVKECTIDEIDKFEKYYIDKYDSINKLYGYNLESGGNLNKIISDEAKNNLSKSHLGIKPSNNTKQKMSDTWKKKFQEGYVNPMTGRKLTQDQIEVISKHSKSRKHSKETIQKLSDSRIGKCNPMYGRNHSIETRIKMSMNQQGENAHRYGKKHSKETIQKIIETKRRKKEGDLIGAS